jgi:hypothetical protein
MSGRPVVPDPAVPSHVGIVSPVPEATMRVLDATVAGPWFLSHDAELSVWMTGHAVAQGVHLTTWWSVSGPTHIEIVQAVPGTIWDVSATVLHHVGYWVPDLAVASSALAAAGSPVEVHGVDGAGMISVFAYHRAPEGLLIELTDGRRREAVTAAIRELGEEG